MSTPSSTKVVVITGASSGIGRSLALALAKENGKASGTTYRLVLAARAKAALDAVVGECGGADVAIGVPTDVTKRGDVKAMLAAAAARWGGIDVLVNNAGVGCAVNPSQLDDAIIDEMMAVNVKSALYGMQEVLPYFADGRKGQIINISSMLGRCPMPNPFALERSAYTCSKHFLTSMTDLFRVELQQTHPHVAVSLFLPGVVATNFGTNAGGGDSRALPGAQDVDEVAAIIAEEVIAKRREDVYSRDMYKGIVEKYLAERHAQ